MTEFVLTDRQRSRVGQMQQKVSCVERSDQQSENLLQLFAQLTQTMSTNKISVRIFFP